MNDVTGMPQSAVVLGGTSDIAGAILAALAARRLKRVVLVGRDQVRLDVAAAALRGLGVATVTSMVADLSVPGPLESIVDHAVSTLGEIDLVLFASGVLGTADLDALTPSGVTASIATNFSGPAAALLAFAKVLVRQGQGHLVVLSSVAGYRVRRQNFVYGAAKAGLDGFAQGLSDALVGSGVDVMIVRPGFVRSRMTVGRKAAPLSVDPPDVAEAVVAGLEAGTPVVWVPSALRVVFTGLRTLPRALWRKMPA